MKTPEKLREEFWKNDEEQGGLIRRQYDEIKLVLKNADMKFAREHYEKIKQYAIDNTVFYKDYSLSMEFPVVNKMDIISRYDEHKSTGEFMKPVHISSTSGSTGTPFSVLQDMVKRKRNIADLKVFGELCDYPSHERMLFFRVFNSHLHRTPEQEDAENIYYIDCSDLSDESLDRMIDQIMIKQPRIIFSYSSTLIEIAKRIIKSGISSDEFTMQAVLTAGEGVSSENHKLLENAFGCKVYRRYSDMELGILGQDMGDEGKYILNWGSYYFECVKMDSDEPAEHGEVGRIVITDLFNKALPMIRYDTGDLGIMDCDEDGSLPYLKEIYGRKRDCVYRTDGVMLSPAKISVSMWGAENVSQWQLIQNDEKEYTFKISSDGVVDREVLLEKFKGILGNDANIEIMIVDDIPVLASNKRRAVICNWDRKAKS